MTKPVRFSLEYRDFKGHEADSVKSIVESYAYSGDFFGYLEFIHNSNRAEPTYHDMVDFRRDIDRVHDVRTRIGEAFLDGSALALDSINIFTPELLPGTHVELLKIRDTLTARHLGRDPSRDDEAAYVSELRSYGHGLTREYAFDYQSIMADISEHRQYTFVEQHLAVMHGFTFLMSAAGKAYEADMEEFEDDMLDEFATDDSILIREINDAIKRKRERPTV